jgi:hypothetical protein
MWGNMLPRFAHVCEVALPAIHGRVHNRLPSPPLRSKRAGLQLSVGRVERSLRKVRVCVCGEGDKLNMFVRFPARLVFDSKHMDLDIARP